MLKGEVEVLDEQLRAFEDDISKLEAKLREARSRQNALLTRLEGIIPALEPCHALAHVAKIAPGLPSDHLIVVNLSGRGDKDIFTVARHLGVEISG